jgi:uracil-DNA glycosylase family 4
MSERRAATLREMGLAPLWRLRQQVSPSAVAAPLSLPQQAGLVSAASPEPVATDSLDARAAAIAAMDWDELQRSVVDCRACALCQTRRQTVFGVGDLQPDWLFVGEGPGAEEDEQGLPFVGQAGKLLDAMLAAIGLHRGDKVYIANTVKCRPPGNRTPEPAESAACAPYLARQIALLQPRLIVAMGRPAAQALLHREVKIAVERGKLLNYKGMALVVTYHPAYLLRNLADKARAWEDLCFARAALARLGTGN